MYNLLQVCHNCCKKCWNFLYTLLSHLVQISRFSCSQTCHKSLASANFVSRHFFQLTFFLSWIWENCFSFKKIFNQRDMPDIAPDKKDPVSLPSQDWVFSTCSPLCQGLLHQDLFCQSQLDILLQEPSPMQSGTSCSIFSKSRLGSLHHSLSCKVQHGPPSAVARAPKVKTNLSAPGSSSHNSARPGSSVN